MGTGPNQMPCWAQNRPSPQSQVISAATEVEPSIKQLPGQSGINSKFSDISHPNRTVIYSTTSWGVYVVSWKIKDHGTRKTGFDFWVCL